MAMNPGDKTVLIPAKSSIVWTKEDITVCTRALGGGESSLRKPGKHRLSFGSGDVFDFTITMKDAQSTDNCLTEEYDNHSQSTWRSQ